MGLISRDSLGVQTHCLRREMAFDFEETLQRIRAMGFNRIELCSFPGCAGNPWGDFGDLAAWSPERIRAAIEMAGLDCIASHIAHKELSPDSFTDTVRWLKGVGCGTAILAGLPPPANLSLKGWQLSFDSLNEAGARLQKNGIAFAYHTQNEVWQELDGVLLADELCRLANPELCLIELDPSGSIVYGTNWMSVVNSNPGRFFAMHLRDGVRPVGHVPYLPAVPLGDGAVDWAASLDTAVAASIPYYLLEMEVEPDHDVFKALQSSIDHLETLQIL